ncbi:MAG: type I restriction enzyme HsdR N-terminal domain-containing protein [Flavobacteriales bacterium Tduv]
METLNFPAYRFRIQSKDNKVYVFCFIRKKFYLLTPEEWVRQHVICFLTDTKGYDPSGIAVEVPIRLDRLSKRLDIVVYKQTHPHIVVECKAPHIKLSQKVFDQVARYHLGLRSSYLMVTNGISHFFCCLDEARQCFEFFEDLPSKGRGSGSP